MTGHVVNKAWTMGDWPCGTWYGASVSYRRRTLRLKR